MVFLLISIFQINYCCGCFQNADRFSKKDNELQWAACVSQSVQETGRVKDPGGGGVIPIMACTGRLRPKGEPFSGFRYRSFSVTWSAAWQIPWNERKF